MLEGVGIKTLFITMIIAITISIVGKGFITLYEAKIESELIANTKAIDQNSLYLNQSLANDKIDQAKQDRIMELLNNNNSNNSE